LTGAVCADYRFYRFLSAVLLHKNCKLACIHFGRSIGPHAICRESVALEHETMLRNALAKNTSVKEFHLSGPYIVNGRPVLKPWLKGLMERDQSNIEILDIYENYHFNIGDEFELASTDNYINIVMKHLPTLRDIRFEMIKSDEMDEFYEKFIDKAENRSKAFTLVNSRL
jgi:hypothetical protein